MLVSTTSLVSKREVSKQVPTETAVAKREVATQVATGRPVTTDRLPRWLPRKGGRYPASSAGLAVAYWAPSRIWMAERAFAGNAR